MTRLPRLHDDIQRWAALDAAAIAIVDGHRQWSVGDLCEHVERLSRGLRSEVEPGGCVAVVSDNCAAMIALLYAGSRSNRPVLLVNTRLELFERELAITEVGASLVLDLTTDTGRASLDSLATQNAGESAVFGGIADGDLPDDETPDDLAWIIYTSGTGGSPKGVRLTHRGLLAAVEIAATARPFAHDDIYLFPFPLFHVAAYNVLHAHRSRRPVVLLPRFEVAAFCAAVEQHRVTTASLAPTMISMLLEWPDRHGFDLSSLRTIAYGSSAIPRDVLVRGMTELGCDFTQGYGMTELSGNAVFLTTHLHRQAATERPELLAAAGFPGPGVELRIVDAGGVEVVRGETGEILVRSAQVCDGYWGQPEATAAAIVDGWLHTGDVGRLDDDGILYVVDRLKDLVVTGGENVSSREVEDVVGAHPDVGSVAVVGVPDERWGERVVAVVTSRADRLLDGDAVLEWCRGRIAGFKRPRAVLVRDTMPMGPSGKVLKRELRDWAAAELARTR